MIGVLAQESQKPTAREFFELFKTPWEFCREGKEYDIILAADGRSEIPSSPLVVVFGSSHTAFDAANQVQLSRFPGTVLLEYEGSRFPTYLGASGLSRPVGSLDNDPVLKTSTTGEPVALWWRTRETQIVRVGYDLFGEIKFLLWQGQPAEFAEIPTLELHVSLLRRCISEAGITFVEIPPVPYGCPFIACLTHDVDFIELKNHRLDRTLAGFLLRSLTPAHYRRCSAKVALARFGRNLAALLSLPAVYLGLGRDIWYDVDRYLELEGHAPSTFYFIPFKGNPGQELPGHPAPSHRAAQYHLPDYAHTIHGLLQNGCEVGVHGLDAWHDAQKGRKELAAVQKETGQAHPGIRMHWLHISEESPKVLREAGYFYDSSIGYNEAVGFRPGTAQVFRQPDQPAIPELPLVVMDTALFYPDRMGLSEHQARAVCARLIDAVRRYGGVLTVNWHTRSLCPERNWDAFYIELLALLENEGACFFTGKQAVSWFLQRRAITIEAVEAAGNALAITLDAPAGPFTPAPCLRVHLPSKAPAAEPTTRTPAFIDVPWTGEKTLHVSI